MTISLISPLNCMRREKDQMTPLPMQTSGPARIKSVKRYDKLRWGVGLGLLSLVSLERFRVSVTPSKLVEASFHYPF